MSLLETYAVSPTFLQVLWLILIAVLWIVYFFLEGFDYGVGMLLPFLGKSDGSRRVMINTIGPHWDGNEVWLLTAGGAIFAAFAGWYATLFSGLYLPLFLVLVGLILRGVSFEYRGKSDSLTWRKTWDWLAAVGSLLPALVFGVGFANFVRGVPVVAVDVPYHTAKVPQVEVFFFNLFTPFALIGGLLFVVLFLTHGAIYLALKTRGEIHDRAQGFAAKAGIGAMALLAIFVIWGNLNHGYLGAGPGNLPGQLPALLIVAWVTGILSLACLAAGWYFNNAKRDGLAFIGTSLSTVLLTVTIFLHLYPGLGFNNSASLEAPLDITTAANSETTLTLMTIVAGVMVPIVLLYTIWSYIKFKNRLSTKNIVGDASPLSAV